MTVISRRAEEDWFNNSVVTFHLDATFTHFNFVPFVDINTYIKYIHDMTNATTVLN